MTELSDRRGGFRRLHSFTLATTLGWGVEVVCNGQTLARVPAPDQTGIIQLDTRPGDRIEFRVRPAGTP